MDKRLFVMTLAVLAIFALAVPAAFAEEGTAQKPVQLKVPDGTQQSHCATPDNASSQKVLPIVFDPEVAFSTGCTADLTCPSGCYISCSGNTSCTVGSTSVTCDGNTTYCPYPSCTSQPQGCLDRCGFCECRASGYGIKICVQDFCF